MKTELIRYCFDTDDYDQRAEYKALRAQLRKTNGPVFCVFPTPGSKSCPAGEVVFETEHLFSNQWNTEYGFRVFDWYEQAQPRDYEHIKRGHYLVITDEMREIRRNTLVCGYCGKQEPAAKGYKFCQRSACAGSPYLEVNRLRLTRLLPVEQHLPTRPPLTDRERTHLLENYRTHQLTTTRKSAVKERMRIIKAHEQATTERDGKLWLLNQDYKLDNVIYYAHKDQWCFGWRTPLTAEQVSTVLNFISEFPNPYAIKCADGRTLEGY